METLLEMFAKGLLASLILAVMAVGVEPEDAGAQALFPTVAVTSSLAPASVAGPVTLIPPILSPLSATVLKECNRCFCFTGEPPHWSTCQGEYGYDCMCEPCSYPGSDCIDFQSQNGIEICETYITGSCGGSLLSGGGGGDCGCDCVEREYVPYPDCDTGGGGSAALLDGTRLYGLAITSPAGEGTTGALQPGLRWEAVPGSGELVRSRCDNTVVARVYTPEQAESIRRALSVLPL
jgi:hypothetical protein